LPGWLRTLASSPRSISKFHRSIDEPCSLWADQRPWLGSGRNLRDEDSCKHPRKHLQEASSASLFVDWGRSPLEWDPRHGALAGWWDAIDIDSVR